MCWRFPSSAGVLGATRGGGEADGTQTNNRSACLQGWTGGRPHNQSHPGRSALKRRTVSPSTFCSTWGGSQACRLGSQSSDNEQLAATQSSPCARRRSQHFIGPLGIHKSLRGKYCCYPCFPDGETEAWEVQACCPRLHWYQGDGTWIQALPRPRAQKLLGAPGSRREQRRCCFHVGREPHISVCPEPAFHAVQTAREAGGDGQTLSWPGT